MSLETASPDPIHISELIKEEKPLQAVDFCYQDEDETITILDCISLCVMVIAFSPETLRSYQMLVSIFQLLYNYLKKKKIIVLIYLFVYCSLFWKPSCHAI